MVTLDIAFIVIIALFAFTGFRFGIVQTLGSVIGIILGVYLASRYYAVAADWLVSVTGWGGNMPKVLMFILGFILVNRLVGFVFWVLDKVTGLVTRLPFINSINRIGGFALGILEGLITVGMFVFFVERFPLSDKLMMMVAESSIAPIVSKMAVVFLPLVPEGIKLLKSTVDFVEGKIL